MFLKYLIKIILDFKLLMWAQMWHKMIHLDKEGIAKSHHKVDIKDLLVMEVRHLLIWATEYLNLLVVGVCQQISPKNWINLLLSILDLQILRNLFYLANINLSRKSIFRLIQLHIFNLALNNQVFHKVKDRVLPIIPHQFKNKCNIYFLISI